MRICLPVALRSVDPAAYGGWRGELGGTGPDAAAYAAMARTAGFSVADPLMDADASRDAIRARVAGLGQRLGGRDDLFWLCWAGHGGQAPDFPEDEPELDRLDEEVLAWDGTIRDGEMRRLLQDSFAPSCTVVVNFDTCFAGGMDRVRGTPRLAPPAVVARAPRGPVVRPRRGPDVPTIIWNLAVQEDETAGDEGDPGDGLGGGTYTRAFVKAWDGGAFRGSWRDLRAAASILMPRRQRPQLRVDPPDRAARLDERPFA